MTRQEAEALRASPRHWHLGVIYACRRDPRVIVRNRGTLGWTWNFGHRLVVPALLAALLLFLGPAYLLISAGGFTTLQVGLALAASLAILVAIASRIANGPR